MLLTVMGIPNKRLNEFRQMRGKLFRSATSLSPSGYIFDVSGDRKIDAVSLSGYIPRDTLVEVVDVSNVCVYVKLV